MLKRTIGRPPTLGGEGKREKITLYIHPATKKEIEEAANSRGMAISEFIRRAVKFYMAS